MGWYSLVFFRKTYFTGLDKLPWDKPFILAGNHPTAFTEPSILCGHSTQGKNCLLRGDMFKKGKWVEYFLWKIKCIPIYRFRDGYSDIKKNQDIMEYCYDLLGKGENLVILAEGVSKVERRMRPIQKGTARMAFGAYEKHQRKDIAIVPIGFNYTNPNKFRSCIYAHFGTPIPITDFLDDHADNPRKAIKKMTDRLSKEMRKSIIHIEEEKDDALGHQLLEMVENNVKEKSLPLFSYKPSRLPEFLQFTEKFNHLSSPKKEQLQQEATLYKERLNQLKISDQGLAQKAYCNIWSTLALLIGLPAFAFGIVANFLPIKIGKYYAQKAANTLEFDSSLRVAFEGGAYLFYFIILLILAGIWGGKYIVITVLLLPLFGHFSLLWRDAFLLWNEGRKVRGIDEKNITELYSLREKLLDLDRI